MAEINQNLMSIANDLIDASITARFTNNDPETSNHILTDAATVYAEAGSDGDAEVCKLLIEINKGDS